MTHLLADARSFDFTLRVANMTSSLTLMGMAGASHELPVLDIELAGLSQNSGNGRRDQSLCFAKMIGHCEAE